MMRPCYFVSTLAFVGLTHFAALSSAHTIISALENPAAASNQSGIGMFSGWACNALSVEIQINNGSKLKAAYGTARSDTNNVCGNTGNNGFGLLYNFNTLGKGTHSAQLWVDGEPAGSPVSFTVTTPNGEFATGLSKTVSVSDFPSSGQTTTLVWQQAMQNFAIASISGTATAPSTSGERTLDNCSTTSVGNVPAFYTKYFKCVDLSMSNGNVVIKTRSLPPHKSNYYGSSSPNYTPFDTSRGSAYHANPNTLAETAVTMTVPSNPVARGLSITTAMVDKVAGTNPNEYTGSPQGIAIDSVQLFHGVAAPTDSIDNEAYTFDNYNAHPAGSNYHYHTGSKGPLEVLKKLGLITTTVVGSAEMELFGMMCDGTLFMGCKELNGADVNTTDLDGQNGHRHNIIDKDGTVHFSDRYHVHACPSKWVGTLARPYTPEIQYYNLCSVTKP
ncbi:MAG: hypothetical protein RLZZ502_1486 [Pseudomonadota bacterium]|jgi:hypothetical protein